MADGGPGGAEGPLGGREAPTGGEGRSGRISSPLAVARRAATLSRIPLGALRDGVERTVRTRLGDERAAQQIRQRAADRLRTVLGDARGGALKAGQLLATVDALFPADPEATWRSALAELPAHNRAEPFEVVARVLVEDLGSDWRRRVRDIEPAAAAAASIGQVHRATVDGMAVAVKIQYPDIAERLRTDLALVSGITRAAAIIAPGAALPPLVGELRDRLVEELDYRREAAVQQRFVDTLDDEPRMIVPGVVEATPRVLITRWVEHRALVELRDEPQEIRDDVAAAYLRFLLRGPERAGWLHTDPHPGNFGLTSDGRFCAIDFGSALSLPGGMPPTFGRLIRALRHDDPAVVGATLRAEGFVRPGSDVDAVKLRDYLSPFTEPSRHEVFTFTPEWLAGQFGRLGDPRNPDFAVALQLTLPPEQLFTHRVWLGIVGVLCQLRATVAVRPVVERWLPGLAEPT